MRFDIYHHHDPYINHRLHTIERNLYHIMSTFQDFQDQISAINDTTNDIANDITALKAKLEGGLSAEEAVAVQDELDALAAKLSGVAAEYDSTPAPAPVE